MADREHVGVVLRGSEAIEAHWQSRRTLKPFNLEGADLKGAYLLECDLHDSILTRADLTRAVLRNANLSGAQLGGARLVQADLSSADLSYADLTEADFTGADLSGANLVGAIFARSDGTGSADVSHARLGRARITPEGAEGFGSFLDLACANGLECAEFESEHGLHDYLERAFGYALAADIHERDATPDLVAAAVERIRAIRSAYRSVGEPRELVEVVSLLSRELLEHLAAHPEALDEVRPRQFEELIAEILASYGWEVELTPETRDGGYDIFGVCKDLAGVRHHWIVECKKNRRDRKVGVDVVRSLYGVKKVMAGANAMLATTSDFSREAKAYKASRYDLDLRNYEAVLEWVSALGKRGRQGLALPEDELWTPPGLGEV